jgi:hypothetical protein
MADTTLHVSEELAAEIRARKEQETSFEEFMWELLDRIDAHQDGAKDESSTLGDGFDAVIEVGLREQ